jgi:hypothetical protein
MPSGQPLPDAALVVRCGQPPFRQGRLLHEAGKENQGYFGISVQCGESLAIEELAVWCPNNKIGLTTVGAIRSAGYDVVVTLGRGHHATLVVPRAWDLDEALVLALLFKEWANPIPETEREPR